ncbi:Endonuclease/exonuclease/phosphatase family protein [Heracleum sosnowskyi]|uniref:Endonuclease/exonuclease/phosphatase family protein n=1 Tax=Heracleum sosnowskyi TaxID=360622 RepID=A0AAD8ICY9_9APIA|nr:Endonuclease/exonuclease/phosphatase family protein [Heracleum sosnowskyi]
MNVLSWNCRGVGLPSSIRFLKDVIRQERPSVIFLCETKDNKGKMESLRRALQFDGLISVDSQGKSGGLALLWKVKDQIQLRSWSRNHIDVEVKVDGKQAWRLSGIYGEPNRNQRRKTWDLFRNLARDSNLPWCAIGDLNNVLTQQDKKGGAPYPSWLIEGFNEVLVETGLIDLDLVGHQFTWERGRGTSAWTEVRLDRALTILPWLNMFPLVKLYNLEGSSSDHSPIMLVPQVCEKLGRSKGSSAR